jgi:glutathione S-transferase
LPVIEPANAALRELKGIHLWHAGFSSCSQRVRLALAELGVDFESHLVNLAAGENATEEYQQIHPDGLVPALVHDGVAVTESVDIIAYLDAQLGDGALWPPSQEDATAALLTQADAAQAALKVCTFEFLFRETPPMSDAEFATFQAQLKNDKLRQFHIDYRAGFGSERIIAAVNDVYQDFNSLDYKLGDGRTWLAGNEFSLADIAWLPNFHRFDLLRWPFQRHPNLSRWFMSASSRASYKAALSDWEPKPLLDSVVPRIEARQLRGDGIDRYGVLAI